MSGRTPHGLYTIERFLMLGGRRLNITNKRLMYRLLSQGEFGNTIRQYFSIDEWETCPDAQRIEVWGVRSLIPSGPCDMYVPRWNVPGLVAVRRYEGVAVNISCMIDAVRDVTLWADVYDSDHGLIVYGIEHPPKGGSWRKLMPSQGREYRGVNAHTVLRRHLNECSLADLEVLREKYPGHVYELSACTRPIGTVPNRNAVMWECRLY